MNLAQRLLREKIEKFDVSGYPSLARISRVDRGTNVLVCEIEVLFGQADHCFGDDLLEVKCRELTSDARAFLSDLGDLREPIRMNGHQTRAGKTLDCLSHRCASHTEILR